MTENRATTILDVGRELMQTRGYSGFSYRDIASAVGIKSASIHYHFPTKADLAVRVTQVYREEFGAILQTIRSSGGTCREQLVRYAELFSSTLISGRLCLCGMLATESELLPGVVRAEVDAFFHDQTGWLEVVLSSGVRTGEFPGDTDVPVVASLLLATLEGSMIIARNRGANDVDLSYVVDAIVPR